MTTMSRRPLAGVISVATEPFKYPRSYKGARQAYEDGMSLTRLRREFHLSEGELHDVAPEEFVEIPQPEGDAGGY